MGPKRSRDWLLVAHPDMPVPTEIPLAAIQAAGPDLWKQRGEPCLPRDPVVGPCRLCGSVKKLTREHTPTKRTSHLGPTRSYELEEWLNRETLDSIPGGSPTQGGIWGNTLCRDCNSFTGHEYGDEYKRWVYGARMLLTQQLPAALGVENHPDAVAAAIESLDNQDGWASSEAKLRDVDPGRFVRQVLSMFCSIAGPWNLATRHPEVRRIVLDGEPFVLPPQLALRTSLYVGRAIRVLGPTFTMTPATSTWRWVCELAYPPFAHYLVLASNISEEIPGLDTGEMTTYAPGNTMNLQAPFEIGLGHTPFPGDYRTRRQVEGA